MKLRLCAIAALAAAALSSQTVNGRVASVSFGTLTGTGTTWAFDMSLLTPSQHTLEVVVAGSPSSCSIQLEGTLDNPSGSSVTWANLSGAQTCTSSVTFSVVNKPVRAVRANLTSLSGGSSPTVTVGYAGVQ
jgi:hypothetical protein